MTELRQAQKLLRLGIVAALEQGIALRYQPAALDLGESAQYLPPPPGPGGPYRSPLRR